MGESGGLGGLRIWFCIRKLAQFRRGEMVGVLVGVQMGMRFG
jgi:hypothetical protein